MKSMIILPLLFLIYAETACAAGEMAFRGTLLDSVPCEINNAEALSVDFGDVGVNKIDGERYLQALSFPLHCPGGPFEEPFRLMYYGQASDFDPAALKTSTEGLGIKLKAQCNGQDFCEVKIGGGIGISMSGNEALQMNFQVVPVKKQGAMLEAGEFNANASFRLEYY
ncbi:putative secreted protein [Enterobacter sp. J49]|uniref:fimbrial protein n=1 Tax=Enterobacter sp. J49 TaxID=1903627 RepID=UPI000B64A8BC|nr:fimbrial protein [Enterobacter sp. J49]OUC37008.1 putative secreted protein [Enterobacter sp. J49]